MSALCTSMPRVIKTESLTSHAGLTCHFHSSRFFRATPRCSVYECALLTGTISFLLLGSHEFKYLTSSWVSISEREWFGFFTTSCKNHGVGRWSKLKNHLDHKCIWWCYTSYLIILEWIVFLIGAKGIRTHIHLTEVLCVFKNKTHKQFFFVFSLKSYVNVEWHYDFTSSSIKCPLLVMLFQKPVAEVCITSGRMWAKDSAAYKHTARLTLSNRGFFRC